MGKSKIEWTEKTWNPVLGCSKVSEGCRNCYAMSMSARIANSARDREDPTAIQQGYMKVVKQDSDGKYLPKWNNKTALIPERLEDPLRWRKPRMVFVNSMSDLFHPDVPFEFIDKVFAVMGMADKHTFQVLTKRPERMSKYLNSEGEEQDFNVHTTHRIKWAGITINGDKWNRRQRSWPLKNVWLGTSVEDQQAADERIPHLLQCPAAVRFLSCEPLLGVVDLNKYLIPPAPSYPWHPVESDKKGPWIDWVIVGGESGPNARPMHPDWARSLRDQCQEAGVAYFFKQWGRWGPWIGEYYPPEEGKAAWVFPDGRFENADTRKEINIEDARLMKNIGKKKAGRLLDGREWNQMPEVR